MNYAADFRRIARNALSGRWGTAVLAGFLAALLGAASSFSVSFSPPGVGIRVDPKVIEQLAQNEAVLMIIAGVLLIFLAFVLVFSVAYYILGGIIRTGYCRFNLDLVDRQKAPAVGTLFRYFRNWSTTTAAIFLQGLFIVLWSLLFVIPGILATYNYAMTFYILSEHPEMTARQALRKSKEMMYGNRWRLFCLNFSFFGWAMLSILTMGVGWLLLVPYTEAATAAFYREISGTACAPD